ncbi:hypothetical protein C8Q79DRAFT_1013465 [Trametes meyenii]|nr:hypothetical protein C8Q79DRAFT_1013465 [Trametes meyenii]
MDTLPLETKQQIFALACTDGGSTGNSLSLTSKSIREASRTSRFHTVYLIADHVRLEAFVALYDRELKKDRGDKPHIRHLFIKFCRTPVPTNESELKQPSSTYLDAGQRLIHAAAPGLYTLMVYASWWSLRHFLYFPVIQNPFPLLREATFVDLCDPRPLFDNDMNISPLFPAVTRLHLLTCNTDLALDTWSIVAPNVTHLRVTGISDGHVDQIAQAIGVRIDVERGLHAILGLPAPPETPTHSLPRTYPNLRYLLLQLCPRPPSGGWCGTEDAAHAMTFQGLRQIEEACNEGSDIRTILLPDLSAAPYSEEDDTSIRASWMASVEGREGCWENISSSGPKW